MRFLLLTVVASMAVSSAACGLDEAGLGPTGASATDGATPADASRGEDAPDSGSTGDDATSHDAPSADAHVSVDSGGHDTASGTCPATPDCSNPACTAEGYACAPPVPDGWSVAAVDFTSSVACAPGYGPSYAVSTAPTGGPAVCGCNCALSSSPSCNVGSIDISIGNSSCNNSVVWDAADGACTPAAASFAPYVQVTSTPGATGGTCTGTPAKTLPPNGSTQAFVCSLSGAPSTQGCTGGNVCVAVASTQSLCILQSGSTSCMGAYSAPHSVGASVDDTRACTGSCTCGGPTASCEPPTWTFYTGGGCTGTATAVDMNGACDPTNPTPSNDYASYRYAADPTGATCGAATSTPVSSGGLSLDDAQSLCCLP